MLQLVTRATDPAFFSREDAALAASAGIEPGASGSTLATVYRAEPKTFWY
jgi:hypothetical protein